MTKKLIYKAVYRTAPATSGLLKIERERDEEQER